MVIRLSLHTTCLLLASALLGCRAEPALELAPVRGRVSLEANGVSHATIQLIPDEKAGTSAPSGLGQTDADGRFEISTPPHGEGTVPGNYKVTVTSYGGNVPQRYGDPVQTPLSVEIPREGLENWTLELTSP